MIKPLGSKVLIKMQISQEVTKTGIILAAKKENKPIIATVISIGNKVMTVKNNDEVIVSRYIGTQIKYDNEEYVILDEKEILAAKRELHEEIGINFDEADLKLIDIYKNEQENNNCFSYTYLVKTNKKIKDMKMQEEEVSELKYISIGELEDKIRKMDEEITFVKKPHIKLALEKIKTML